MDGPGNVLVEDERRDGFDGVVEYSVGMYSVVWKDGVDTKLAHGENNGLPALDEILVHGIALREKFITSVTILMNDLHLLDDSGFPGLSGTLMSSQDQHNCTPWSATRNTHREAGFCIPCSTA